MGDTVGSGDILVGTFDGLLVEGDTVGESVGSDMVGSTVGLALGDEETGIVVGIELGDNVIGETVGIGVEIGSELPVGGVVGRRVEVLVDGLMLGGRDTGNLVGAIESIKVGVGCRDGCSVTEGSLGLMLGGRDTDTGTLVGANEATKVGGFVEIGCKEG